MHMAQSRHDTRATLSIYSCMCIAVFCRLFRDGNVSWGRIVTLLCFGYRMAVTVIQRGIRGFFSHIVGFVVKFILTEKIAKWIADQGGWVGSWAIHLGNSFWGRGGW